VAFDPERLMRLWTDPLPERGALTGIDVVALVQPAESAASRPRQDSNLRPDA
jgi:hypothetical protein